MLALKKKINYSRQKINNSDYQEIKKVLKSDFLTQGPKVPEFEKKISKFCNSKFAVACNSATSALHVACLSINLSKDDIVWTNPVSFVASANCAIYCGAKVEFIDIDLKKFNITFEKFKKKILDAKRKKKLPKLLILVDYGGFPCDLDRIYKLAKRYNVIVIQDSSHSLGAKFKNSQIGDCKYSDITVFSFHPVKIITSGEGGVATTNNKIYFEKMQLLRTHGITKKRKFFKKKVKHNWHYEQLALGYNYRMNDIEAALGISQLKRINKNLKSRREIAKNYFNNLNSRITTIKYDKNVKSSFHLFPILIDKNKAGISRDQMYYFLKKKGINCQIHYIPIFEHPFHKIEKKIKKKLYPNSLKFYQTTLSIPMYNGLTNKEQKYVIHTINGKLRNGYSNNYSKKR